MELLHASMQESWICWQRFVGLSSPLSPESLVTTTLASFPTGSARSPLALSSFVATETDSPSSSNVPHPTARQHNIAPIVIARFIVISFRLSGEQPACPNRDPRMARAPRRACAQGARGAHLRIRRLRNPSLQLRLA